MTPTSPTLIANVTKGSQVQKLITYDLIGLDRYAPRTGAEIIGCSLPTADPDLIVKEFKRVIASNKPVKNPIYRISLSLRSGMSLSPLMWQDVARVWLKRALGISVDDHHFWITKHIGEHEHIHISLLRFRHASREGSRGGGRLWSPPFQGLRTLPTRLQVRGKGSTSRCIGQGRSTTPKPNARSFRRA